MEAGCVKIAEDSDFDELKKLVDDNTEWKLEYDKGEEVRVCFTFYIGCARLCGDSPSLILQIRAGLFENFEFLGVDQKHKELFF